MWLALGLFFLASARCEDFYSISIVRDKSVMERMLEVNTHPNDLYKVFGRSQRFRSTGPGPKPQNDTVQLYKYLQSQFAAEVLIGSPGQKFRMVLDTAFTHSWVTSVLCSPFQYPPCALRNKYDSTKSTTYVDVGANYTIDTDKGKLFGFVSKDKFHMGHMSIMNQSFAEIEGVSLMQLLYSSFDGQIGLGFVEYPNDTVVPIFLNIIAQKLVAKPILSFYFNRDKSTPKGGTLFLGSDQNRHHDGNFTYLSCDALWTFKVDKIWIHYRLPYKNMSASVCNSGCDAYPSSADVLIVGPPSEIKIVNRFLGAHYVPFIDRYEVPCEKVSKFPQVTFVIGGKNFTIHGKDYIQEVMYGPLTLCLSAFAPSHSNFWGLGVSFLARYYVSLNVGKKTIGFANAIP